LTGVRRAEVFGLEVSDVNFERQTVTFRPNGWRRLETRISHRTVRLWPRLEEILRAYLSERTAKQVMDNEPTRALLFPRIEETGVEALLVNFDKALDQLAERAGWQQGEIRSKMFRHTYCSARLQTLDRGAPAPWPRSWATAATVW
jgi:integrase